MTYKVPEGWKVEELKSTAERLWVIAPDGRSSVTVCFAHRGYRTGFHFTHISPTSGNYGGLGWRQRLVDAAVAHLKQILEN